MLSTEFRVDMAVWQDGVTFQSSLASKPARAFDLPETAENKSFAEYLNAPKTVTETSVVPAVTAAPVAPVIMTENLHAPTVLKAQTKTAAVQEMPASLANVQDLTPFVVSADNAKPGSRLNDQMERTSFTKESKKIIDRRSSPYNMSDEKAAAREASAAPRKMQGPDGSKVFPMNTAARYHDGQTKYGINQQLTASASDQAKQLRIKEMQQQAKAKTVAETNTSLAQKKATALSPADIDAIRSQVGSDGFGYKRENLPSASNEKTSAAASWFPEAMTRQLDAYEAARKVAAKTNVSAPSTDLNV